jgi:aldehyde:ferredoxin oxidoreductase
LTNLSNGNLFYFGGIHMANGYWNKVLRVDLTQNKIMDENVPEETWKQVLGGGGFGAKILYDEVSEETKPFDPDNRIVFALGPFQATKQTGSAKFIAVTKSPLTGIFGETAAGAGWAIELKKAGYDAIIIQGEATSPVFLWINDGKAELKDSSRYWGMDSYDASDAILSDLKNEKAKIVTIGQAGEKLVAFACIVADKHSFGGRCGIGAVMGAKKLKAIAVKGSKNVEVNSPDKLALLTKEIGKKVFENTKDWLRQDGTAAIMVGSVESGDAPVKYWAGDVWKEGAEKLGSPSFTRDLDAKPNPCVYCTIGCHRHIKVIEPVEYAMEGAGPEYESLAMLGSCCLMDDVKALAKMNDLCNRYGLDTISTGAFIGFSMECYERGIISSEDTNGIDLKWGNKDAMISLIHKIANREGYGDVASQGIVNAAKSIGGQAIEIAAHVKGLDIPAHDPRAYFSLAVNYATSSTGAHHERGNPQVASMGFLLPEAGVDKEVDRFEMEYTGFLAAKYQDYATLTNSLVHCKFMLFGGMTLTDLLDTLNAVTGWEWSMGDFLKAGERIFTLQRLLNNKYGITRKDDKLPKKLLIPAEKGSRAGKAPLDYEKSLDNYYALRGWNSKGVPTDSKLKELDLH